MEHESTTLNGRASTGYELIGTVTSDQDTPTFETVRIKLKSGKEVKPGALVRIPTKRYERETVLIARIKSAYERNPNESADDINVRDTLEMEARYPKEEDSTIIFRQVEAELLEEIGKDEEGKEKISSPETLPVAGSKAFLADETDTVKVLGLETDPAKGLAIGHTRGGLKIPVVLKREAIQRHLFIGGTTGSGKSYAMGVLLEELIKHNLPVVFIDTQDEYAELVTELGGVVKTPGEDFSVRISSLTDRELTDLIPSATPLQKEIIAVAFNELKTELASEKRDKFSIDDVVARIEVVGPILTAKKKQNKEETEESTNVTVYQAKERTKVLNRNAIYGEKILAREDWPSHMIPCMSVRCKHLSGSDLQNVATSILRELQDLRLRGFIPPYVIVIDEAHLFVPQGESSPCKQIIREGVRIGRHHGIAMVLLTQSPVDIDKSAIRQCNTRMVFALEPDQLEAIKGVKADATDEMLRALPKMPRGQCLLSGTYETLKHAVIVQIRERTTTAEGGKTPDIFGEMANGLTKPDDSHKWSKHYHAQKKNRQQ